MNTEAKQTLVKKELEHLLIRHGLLEAVSAIDEIVLEYVLGVLECLNDNEDLDEIEDVEPFADVMAEYFPGFAAIGLPNIGEWMSSVTKQFSHAPDVERLTLQQSEMSEDKRSSAEDKIPSNSLAVTFIPTNPTLQQNAGSMNGNEGAYGERKILVQDIDSESLATLRELCPAASTAELQHCLHMSEGNVEEAACLLLFRQESGIAVTVRTAPRSRKKSSIGDCLQNDESVKDSILAKYSFVDTSEDKTEHRPELFRKEQKKMIRYREGQVVSTKGERFSEIKKQESEEMKKTYVNIKPQRKYRFH